MDDENDNELVLSSIRAGLHNQRRHPPLLSQGPDDTAESDEIEDRDHNDIQVASKTLSRETSKTLASRTELAKSRSLESTSGAAIKPQTGQISNKSTYAERKRSRVVLIM